MNREDAKQYIIHHASEHLKRDGSKKGFVCPICGSGTGAKGTGLSTKDGIHFTCWAGCFTNSDIIDIIGQERGLSDFNSKFKAACEEYGIEIDRESYKVPSTVEFSQEKKRNAENMSNTQINTHNMEHTTESTQKEEIDYTSFFLQANKDIEKTDYHRGISLDTLNRFKVGYVAEWQHPKAPTAPASPRLIVPTSKHSYLARDTRADLKDSQRRYSKSKVGAVRIFNPEALETAQQPIFVVEGEIDAMSIVDVGGEAIALGSTSNKRKLVELLKQNKPKHPLILSLDNDEAGSGTSKYLEEELKRLDIPYSIRNVAGECKDANEALQQDREAFRACVTDIKTGADEQAEAEREALLEEINSESVANNIQKFIDEIRESKKAKFFSTGFSNLDKILDGGLYAGLYIVGAISSLGKTTLCLQIADNIAKAGHDVLIFSLEMARNELIAKSISRLSLLQDMEKNNGSTAHAKTTRGILTGSRYDTYSKDDEEVIGLAMYEYSKYADKIFIQEGIGDIGVEDIRKRVERHKAIKGEAPVVLIDYLQILAPADMRATDKQNTDKAVLELKRMSRDYSIPVLAISSFNRENYTAPVNMASFKESGAIEFSSDVLIGLQYDGMDYTKEDSGEAGRQKRIRELIERNIVQGRQGNAVQIQAKILKNRNGSKGDAVFNFYPMFNYFREKEGGER